MVSLFSVLCSRLGPFCSIDGFALSRLVTGQGCVDMGVEDNLLLSGARRHRYTTFCIGYWPCMLIYQMHLSSLLLSENERCFWKIYIPPVKFQVSCSVTVRFCDERKSIYVYGLSTRFRVVKRLLTVPRKGSTEVNEDSMGPSRQS